MIDSDEIKQRIDIVEYISRYTPLHKAGRLYKGLCPFHTEKTPSFYVYPDQATWHCYGACGAGGDVIEFVKKKENVEFLGAVEILASQLGIDISRSEGDGRRENRTSLYELNDEAAAYFASMLRDSPQAAAARDYIERRGIDAETVEAFGLGFAPDRWDGLRDHLSEKGYDIETQLLAGVIKHNPDRDSYYDAFRNRVVVPIRDPRGRIIGFGGRVLDDSVPKYLNTGDTPLFKKSHVVFAFDRARSAIRDAGHVVIVEGYMDVIAAHQFGYKNVVACMGTALTGEQLRLMQRDTRKFIFALDADAAGQRATVRGINQARQGLERVKKPVVGAGRKMRLEERLGAELYILSMPDGMDPDDLIRQDPKRWQTLIDQAQPLVDYFFGIVAGEYDMESAEGKSAAVSALTPLIAELEDDVAQRHYIQKLSRLVSVDELTIEGRVRSSAATSAIPRKETPRSQRNGGRTPAQSVSGRRGEALLGPPPATLPAAPSQGGKLDGESYLLANLLQQPDAMIWMTVQAEEHNIAPPLPEDWQETKNRVIFEALSRHLAGDAPWEPELFRHGVPEALHAQLDRLLSAAESQPACEREELWADMLKVLLRVRMEHLRSAITQIKFAVAQAQREGDFEAVRSFNATHNWNLRELNHLQNTLANLTRVLAAQGRSRQGVKIH